MVYLSRCSFHRIFLTTTWTLKMKLGLMNKARNWKSLPSNLKRCWTGWKKAVANRSALSSSSRSLMFLGFSPTLFYHIMFVFRIQVVTLQEAKLLLKEDDDLIITIYDYWLNKRLKHTVSTRELLSHIIYCKLCSVYYNTSYVRSLL